MVVCCSSLNLSLPIGVNEGYQHKHLQRPMLFTVESINNSKYATEMRKGFEHDCKFFTGQYPEQLNCSYIRNT